MELLVVKFLEQVVVVFFFSMFLMRREVFFKKMKKFVNVSFKFSNSGSEIIYKGN